MIIKRIRIAILTLLSLFAVAIPGAAQAEVAVTFYSHEFGDEFPHAFIVLKGTVDATGQRVDDNFGFTAKNVSPAVLLGSVIGVVEPSEPKYVRSSNPHFTVSLDDAGYRRLMSRIDYWRNLPQKSYNLGKRNCVHFIMDMASTVGLKVNSKSRFFKKPRSFLNEVKRLNAHLK